MQPPSNPGQFSVGSVILFRIQKSSFRPGYALNVQDGILRLRYRNDRSRPELMRPEEIYQVDVLLAPTSNLFASGHRIRVDLSSSNYPRFDLNPNTGEPLGVSGRAIPADVSIHHAYPPSPSRPVPIPVCTASRCAQASICAGS
jgi:putative CocE/NonD family hydrolase